MTSTRIRSYGDVISVPCLVQKTGETRARTYDLWFTRREAIPLHTTEVFLRPLENASSRPDLQVLKTLKNEVQHN